MAEDHRSRGPRHDQAEESQYPPLPGEEDDRRGLPYHARPAMASGAVTLPSIQDAHGGYGPPGRAWDPRTGSYGTSPSSANGYAPPPPGNAPPPQGNYSPAGTSGGYPPPPGHHYLPPVQPLPPDGRGSYPPSDPRAPQYYSPGRPGPPGANYDFAYRPDRGGPPGPYGGYPPQDYARVGQPGMMQPSAPRQRTSIACKYCRRRKIRCSGYQNSPGGKCTNCIKMNQECLFQPVSAAPSTAFVPLSALQNGIPPGTQLFGAYGQPLSAPPPNGPPSGGSYPPATPQYEQPLPSPTGSFQSYAEERVEAGMRRQRPPEEDHGMRLPPPTTFPDDGVRRRSPSSSGSPGHLAPYGSMPPQGPPQQHAYDNRTPPPRGSPSGPPPNSQTPNPMSLGSIMDSGPSGPGSANDIDKGMLGRLNRRRFDEPPK